MRLNGLYITQHCQSLSMVVLLGSLLSCFNNNPVHSCIAFEQIYHYARISLIANRHDVEHSFCECHGVECMFTLLRVGFY